MIVADVSIIPMGVGESISAFVKRAIEEMRKSGVRVEIGAMSTVLEANDVESIFRAVQRAREVVFEMGAKRVYTILRIDERRDKELSIETKISALQG
ncbi:MAG: MTH1187 family thiamine-binding protein [Archaeoglobaceae archaeon]